MLDPADPGPDYTLAWPRELFSREASVLLRAASTWSLSRAELLLEEAFVGDVPHGDLRAISWDDLPSSSAYWNPGSDPTLWRGRSATNQNKRSAIVTLARVFEDRKTLLKRELLSKDENALFEVANQYDLRHRNATQRSDYDPVFLDWVFWWYLATVELTDRLHARQARP